MFSALVDLVLPATCALCHVPGGPLCPQCRDAVSASFHPAPRLATPSPLPPGMPACWACAEATPALRAAVTAYKDEDRRELARLLAGWLEPALRTAVLATPGLAAAVRGRGVLVVPVTGSPRARRRRGDVPLVPVVTTAAARLPGRIVVAPALRATRVTRDQSTLSAAERAENLAGSMRVAGRFERLVRGAHCVVVDDLVTTGSTFVEAARALHEAGAEQVVGAAIGAVKRRQRTVRRLSGGPT